MRFGILGGTFNPIHWGHLLLAETARDELALDRVLFVVANRPPHKRDRSLLPGAVRFELVKLAIRDHPAFVVSDLELQRAEVSYSLETVSILRKQLPSAKLFLLMGQDMLTVPWKGWDHLKQWCTIVVAHRPGSSTPPRQAGLKWLTMPHLDISSSDIRRRLKAGRSIRYLVPAPVERYIQQRGLYRKAFRQEAATP